MRTCDGECYPFPILRVSDFNPSSQRSVFILPVRWAKARTDIGIIAAVRGRDTLTAPYLVGPCQSVIFADRDGHVEQASVVQDRHDRVPDRLPVPLNCAIHAQKDSWRTFRAVIVIANPEAPDCEDAPAINLVKYLQGYLFPDGEDAVARDTGIDSWRLFKFRIHYLH